VFRKELISDLSRTCPFKCYIQCAR